MIKILPVTYPEITAYPHHAHLLAMYNGLYQDDNYLLAWFCNNYIQLEYESYNLDFSSGFDILPLLENCPWLIKDSISYSMIKQKWKNIIEFLIDSIDIGYYIYMEVDEYYIKEYENYKKKHRSHTLLLYGYDDEKKIFFVSDFFKNSKYCFAESSFSEINDGYENKPSDFLCGVILYRKNTGFFKYCFEKDALINNLNDYINSYNTKNRNMIINYKRVMPHNAASYFGIEIYEQICKEILECENIDLRHLYVILAHKKILMYIILALSKRSMLNDDYNLYRNVKSILDECKINLNLGTKYNILHNDKIKDKIIKALQNIRSQELLIIPLIICNIRNESKYMHYFNNSFEKEEFGLRIRNCNIENNIYISNGDKAYVQATFIGTSISYIAKVSSKYGECIIFIDGEKYQSVSLYAEIEKEYHEIIEINLIFGIYHTVRIENCMNNIFNIKSFMVKKNQLNKEIKMRKEFSFLGVDKETSGNWKGIYGTMGYAIPGCEIEYPPNGDVDVQNVKTFINNNILCSDALLQHPNEDKKVMTCYYDENKVVINVVISGFKKQKVTFYLLDWTEQKNITGVITTYNTESGEAIHMEYLKSFSKGIYVSYDLLGSYKFSIQYECQGVKYGDFYGAFFD